MEGRLRPPFRLVIIAIMIALADHVLASALQDSRAGACRGGKSRLRA